MLERGAKGIVLDLRGNGGGLLRRAVLVSSIFIEDGVMVSTKGRTRPSACSRPSATRSPSASRWWCSWTAARPARPRS